VEWDLLSNGVGGWEYLGDVVVAKSDTNVLGDVALMDHISSGGGHFHNDFLLSILGSLVNQPHLFSAVLDLLNIKLQSECGIDRLNFDLELMIGESGEHFDLLGVFMMNLYLLNGELRVALAVRGELTGKHSEAHLQLMQVCPRHLNQHVGRSH
jgi:hypothetical protein